MWRIRKSFSVSVVGIVAVVATVAVCLCCVVFVCLFLCFFLFVCLLVCLFVGCCCCCRHVCFSCDCSQCFRLSLRLSVVVELIPAILFVLVICLPPLFVVIGVVGVIAGMMLARNKKP